MPSIAILGAGNMASALALNLARHAVPVRLYCIEADVAEDINLRHQNQKYLTGVCFPDHITASADMRSVLQGASTVFIAVPSHVVSEVVKKARPFLEPDTVILSISKGLDHETLQPLIMKEKDALPPEFCATLTCLGGPAIANEMARDCPMGLIAASEDPRGAETARRLLETPHVKIATSRDVLGVGLASALKNPYAIALGMCDGLIHPTNAKAFVLTIAIEEMSRLMIAAGAHPSTVYGLAGLGDLIVTSFSPHGRNRSYGERLVGACSKQPSDLGLTTVEGIQSIKLVLKLAKKFHTNVPLLESIHACLEAEGEFSKPFEEFLRTLVLL